MSLLAEKPGQVVTREELQSRLWPEDTFVDFEDGINTGVKKLREALGDDPEKPRYIETIPRRGYRFIAKVRHISAPIAWRLLWTSCPHLAPFMSRRRRFGVPRTRWKTWLLGALAAVVLCSAWVSGSCMAGPRFPSTSVRQFWSRISKTRLVTLVLTKPFAPHSSSAWSNLATLTCSLKFESGTVLKLMGKSSTERVTPALGREICQRENIRGLIAGSITRTGQEFALSAQLIDPQTGATVRSYMERSYGEDHLLDALDVIAADIRTGPW